MQIPITGGSIFASVSSHRTPTHTSQSFPNSFSIEIHYSKYSLCPILSACACAQAHTRTHTTEPCLSRWTDCQLPGFTLLVYPIVAPSVKSFDFVIYECLVTQCSKTLGSPAFYSLALVFPRSHSLQPSNYSPQISMTASSRQNFVLLQIWFWF